MSGKEVGPTRRKPVAERAVAGKPSYLDRLIKAAEAWYQEYIESMRAPQVAPTVVPATQCRSQFPFFFKDLSFTAIWSDAMASAGAGNATLTLLGWLIMNYADLLENSDPDTKDMMKWLSIGTMIGFMLLFVVLQGTRTRDFKAEWPWLKRLQNLFQMFGLLGLIVVPIVAFNFITLAVISKSDAHVCEPISEAESSEAITGYEPGQLTFGQFIPHHGLGVAAFIIYGLSQLAWGADMVSAYRSPVDEYREAKGFAEKTPMDERQFFRRGLWQMPILGLHAFNTYLLVAFGVSRHLYPDFTPDSDHLIAPNLHFGLALLAFFGSAFAQLGYVWFLKRQLGFQLSAGELGAGADARPAGNNQAEAGAANGGTSVRMPLLPGANVNVASIPGVLSAKWLHSVFYTAMSAGSTAMMIFGHHFLSVVMMESAGQFCLPEEASHFASLSGFVKANFGLFVTFGMALFSTYSNGATQTYRDALIVWKSKQTEPEETPTVP